MDAILPKLLDRVTDPLTLGLMIALAVVWAAWRAEVRDTRESVSKALAAVGTLVGDLRTEVVRLTASADAPPRRSRT